MMFSHLNLKTYAFAVRILHIKESWNCYHPEDFSSANCPPSTATVTGITTGYTVICRELPAHGRGIHRKNGYSAGNYQLMDEESTGRKVIPPGITSS
jgi:hypothetical protein